MFLGQVQLNYKCRPYKYLFYAPKASRIGINLCIALFWLKKHKKKDLFFCFYEKMTIYNLKSWCYNLLSYSLDKHLNMF